MGKLYHRVFRHVDRRYAACLRRDGLLNSVLLIVLGLLLIAGGFGGSRHVRKPYDSLVAWGAPVGLLVTLTGITLLMIPNFFG